MEHAHPLEDANPSKNLLQTHQSEEKSALFSDLRIQLHSKLCLKPDKIKDWLNELYITQGHHLIQALSEANQNIIYVNNKNEKENRDLLDHYMPPQSLVEKVEPTLVPNDSNEFMNELFGKMALNPQLFKEWISQSHAKKGLDALQKKVNVAITCAPSLAMNQDKKRLANRKENYIYLLSSLSDSIENSASLFAQDPMLISADKIAQYLYDIVDNKNKPSFIKLTRQVNLGHMIAPIALMEVFKDMQANPKAYPYEMIRLTRQSLQNTFSPIYSTIWKHIRQREAYISLEEWFDRLTFFAEYGLTKGDLLVSGSLLISLYGLQGKSTDVFQKFMETPLLSVCPHLQAGLRTLSERASSLPDYHQAQNNKYHYSDILRSMEHPHDELMLKGFIKQTINHIEMGDNFINLYLLLSLKGMQGKSLSKDKALTGLLEELDEISTGNEAVSSSCTERIKQFLKSFQYLYPSIEESKQEKESYPSLQRRPWVHLGHNDSFSDEGPYLYYKKIDREFFLEKITDDFRRKYHSDPESFQKWLDKIHARYGLPLIREVSGIVKDYTLLLNKYAKTNFNNLIKYIPTESFLKTFESPFVSVDISKLKGELERNITLDKDDFKEWLYKTYAKNGFSPLQALWEEIKDLDHLYSYAQAGVSIIGHNQFVNYRYTKHFLFGFLFWTFKF